MAICAFAMILFASTIKQASSLPNPAWEAQRVQAEQYGNASALRRLKFISTAGTIRCLAEWNCTNGVMHTSCCGEADAYEADEIEIDENGNHVATLTCNDPDDCLEVPGKVVRPAGSKFIIPPDRFLVNHDPVNNTGHGWVWLSPYDLDSGSPKVYCYSFPPGS